MKRKVLWLLLSCLLLVSLVLTSCAGDMMPGGQSSSSPGWDSYAPSPEEYYGEEEEEEYRSDATKDTGSGADYDTSERMIVREGYLDLVVTDVIGSIESIGQTAEKQGGYIVSSSSWQEDDRTRGVIAVRVPVEKFDATMKSFADLAVEITYQTTSSVDVTAEYVDLGSRLQNLEATREQLLDIMEQAETVAEILAVQAELTKTGEEIELIKGRMQYLEQTTDTSLIRVELEQSSLSVTFSADYRVVQTGESIRFYANVAGAFAPYNYEWDFGDGETSTDEQPRHRYQSEGDYTVTLSVTDDRGNTETEVRESYISVEAGWSPGGVAEQARQGLLFFGRGWATIFIWFGVFSPVWVVIGFLIYWFGWRRRKKKKAQEQVK